MTLFSEEYGERWEARRTFFFRDSLSVERTAAKGGFQVGQTAKARSGRRVQSLPIRAMAAYTFLMS